MELGVELVARQTLPLQACDSFEMLLTIGGNPVADTLGSDYYHCADTIVPGQRISATGRKCLHRRTNGSEVVEICSGPAEPSVLPSSWQPILLMVETPLSLSASEFCTIFALRLVDNQGGTKDLILTAEKVLEDWHNHGKYLIDLSAWVYINNLPEHHSTDEKGCYKSCQIAN